MSMEKKASRVAYGEYIAKLGDTNDKLVVLDADLAGATMTQYFKKAHPDRFFDCGIVPGQCCKRRELCCTVQHGHWGMF